MRLQKIWLPLVVVTLYASTAFLAGCGSQKKDAAPYHPANQKTYDNEESLAADRLTSLSTQEIACEDGKDFLPLIHEVADLFAVPVDIVLAQIKQESGFQNLPLTSDQGNNSFGMGQVNVAEWVACGEEPETKRLGLSAVFTAEEFAKGEHPLNPRYNVMALTAALRRTHRIFSQTLEAKRDHFGRNLVGWLAAGAAFNGGFNTWSVIYNQMDVPRKLNWNAMKASELVDLIRTGKGEKSFFATHSVARHVAYLAVWLNQPNVTFCKLDNEQRTVGECGITAKTRIAWITEKYGSPVCFSRPRF